MKPNSIDAIVALPKPAVMIFCAGFEARATRAPELLVARRASAQAVIILTYKGGGHGQNLQKIRNYGLAMCSGEAIVEIDSSDNSALRAQIGNLSASLDSIAIDVTGLARVPMMEILSILFDKGIETHLIYTEADEYYPRKQEFEALTRGKESRDAFLMLSKFEEDEIIYSSQCEIEEVPSLTGRMYPNYPLMLITFLTFKRGRVSAILQSFEANIRVLVKGVPARDDLKWRADAIEIPNSDLLDDSQLFELDTLDWTVTYDFLSKMYEDQNNKYKFNFVLAPLGSKMQTVGAWLFARERRDVRVISSTPRKIFQEKYSSGYRDTFVYDKFLNSNSDRDIQDKRRYVSSIAPVA